MYHFFKNFHLKNKINLSLVDSFSVYKFSRLAQLTSHILSLKEIDYVVMFFIISFTSSKKQLKKYPFNRGQQKKHLITYFIITIKISLIFLLLSIKAFIPILLHTPPFYLPLLSSTSSHCKPSSTIYKILLPPTAPSILLLCTQSYYYALHPTSLYSILRLYTLSLLLDTASYFYKFHPTSTYCILHLNSPSYFYTLHPT